MNEPSDLAFWATAAADYLRPLFTAAILTSCGAGRVATWISDESFGEAEKILRSHGLATHANRLADFRTEPPNAKESIKATMLSAVTR